MHPAFSVIFFTVSSGLGYGLLALIGSLGTMGFLPADRFFGLTGIAIALISVTAGLLSSTFHLGHPERSWRAFSQWRSSWLSREGIAAVATYGPVLALAAAWMWPDQANGWGSVAGLVSALMALLTIYCTAMIYRSLKTVPEWANDWTVINYMILGIASGAVSFVCLLTIFGHAAGKLNFVTVAIIVIAWFVKRIYWHHIDTDKGTSTAETATGLGRFGRVRSFEAPHTEDNYLLKEMGYQVARRHAAKLRIYAQIFAFLIPAGLISIIAGHTSAGAILAGTVAWVSMIVGLVIERWLVFAEARHVVTLFYGRGSE